MMYMTICLWGCHRFSDVDYIRNPSLHKTPPSILNPIDSESYGDICANDTKRENIRGYYG
jgi:hypothetical protein